MNPEAQGHKEEYAKAVCYFLAEELRVKKIGLPRAAEIAQKVVDNLNLIDSEKSFLQLVKNLSQDFEELFQLEKRLQIGIQISERKEMEAKVREFVVNILPQDTGMALQVLKEATQADIKVDDLRKDFPEFDQFMEKDKT